MVDVEYIITRVSLEVPPTVQGKLTSFILVVHGGPLVNFRIQYGDGKSHFVSSANLTRDNLTTPTVVAYRYQLYHNYSDVGVYDVSVNVSNHVSSMVQTARATVEEPIEGVELTSDSNPIVRLGQPVSVRLTIASGNNLICDWAFGENGTPVQSDQYVCFISQLNFYS